MNNRKYSSAGRLASLSAIVLAVVFLFSGCYSFKDVSIPPNVKTVRVMYLENKARYINPALAPQLTERLRQKIASQTRLTQTNNDNADYVISGYVSGYDVSTSGVSGQQAATNRLNVSFHLVLKDNTAQPPGDPKEFDVTRNFDFSASLSLTAAEAQLNDEILKNMTDEIFNKIFSNW